MNDDDTEVTHEHWLKEYIRKYPLTAGWNLALSVGGLVLLVYHLGLGYIPDFELSDLFGIFISTTLSGLFFLVVVMVLGLAPAYFLKLFDKEDSNLDEAGDVLELSKGGDPKAAPLERIGLKTEAHGKNNRKIFSSIFDHLALLLAPLSLFSIAILCVGDLFSEYPISRSLIKWMSVIAVSFVCVFLLLKNEVQVLVRVSFVEEFKKVTLTNAFRLILKSSKLLRAWKGFFGAFRYFSLRKIVGFIAWLIFSVLFFFVAYLFADAGLIQYQVLTFIWYVLFFAVVNVIIYAGRLRIAAIVSVSALFVSTMIPLITNHPLLFPEIIVRMMGVGSVKVVNMTLSFKQCALLNPAGVNCSSSLTGDAQMALQNVNLLSRVGSTALVEVIGVRDTKKKEVSDLFGDENGVSVSFNEVISNRLCRSNQVDGKDNLCGICDESIVEKTAAELTNRLSLKIEKSSSSEKEKRQAEFKRKLAASLVCYRVAIPKDQITNLAISGRRSYFGFTRYLLPDLKNNKQSSDQ